MQWSLRRRRSGQTAVREEEIGCTTPNRHWPAVSTGVYGLFFPPLMLAAFSGLEKPFLAGSPNISLTNQVPTAHAPLALDAGREDTESQQGSHGTGCLGVPSPISTRARPGPSGPPQSRSVPLQGQRSHSPSGQPGPAFFISEQVSAQNPGKSCCCQVKIIES